MKFWILLTLICTTHLSIAATCSASEDSGSMDKLLNFANDSLAATDEIGEEPKLESIDKTRICFKTDSASRAAKNSYETFKHELKMALDKRKIPYTDVEEYLNSNLASIQCKNRGGLKVRKSNSLFKYAIDTINYRLIDDAIYIKVNGQNVCNPKININQSEIIDETTRETESLVQFINKIIMDENMHIIHTPETLISLRNKIEGCSKK